MKILINCSNLRQGGGIQVADSICSLLGKYTEHDFVLVLSSPLYINKSKYIESTNVKVLLYDMPKSIQSMLFLRDRYLDSVVSDHRCDVVLTIFGPSRWKPRVPHLSGFARAQILPMNTPYLKGISLKHRFLNFVVKKLFDYSADYYWTENEAISRLLLNVFPQKKVFTVSNTYNQVFDNNETNVYNKLPEFDGVSLLTVTNAYPHKNLSIALDVAKILYEQKPTLKLRFVMTIDEGEFPCIPHYLRDYFLFIGKVDISECPSLYEQVDIMFQPSLLECFTATYAEAMKKKIPIVTTNLDFAVGLCGDAASYYSAIDSHSAVDAILKVINDKDFVKTLIDNGTRRLATFGNSEERINKLVDILEIIVEK